MARPAQTYRNHWRFFAPFHYFAMPVLLANLVVEIVRLGQETTLQRGWAVVVALALLALGASARLMALRAQSRVIRLEERLRLERLLPAAEHQVIPTLSTRQLVGLRFAPDAEAPDVGTVTAVVAQERRRSGAPRSTAGTRRGRRSAGADRPAPAPLRPQPEGRPAQWLARGDPGRHH